MGIGVEGSLRRDREFDDSVDMVDAVATAGVEQTQSRSLFRRFRGLGRHKRRAASALLFDKFLRESDADVAAMEEQGKLLTFLEWIIEHQEQIRAFIEMIIGLFAGAPIPVAAGEAASDVYGANAPVFSREEAIRSEIAAIRTRLSNIETMI